MLRPEPPSCLPGLWGLGPPCVREAPGTGACPLSCAARRLGGPKSCTGWLVSGGTGTAGPLPGVDRAVWNDSVEA